MNNVCYISLGSSPYEEDCAQIGRQGYETRALAECNAYLHQMERIARAAGFTLPNEKVELVIQPNAHDFGTYYEVNVRYDGDDEEVSRLVIFLDSNNPTSWDAEARTELNLPKE